MSTIIFIIDWFRGNLGDITTAIAYIIAAASIIVKITPTLKDDAALKKIVKFLGKYIALDKYGPNGDE